MRNEVVEQCYMKRENAVFSNSMIDMVDVINAAYQNEHTAEKLKNVYGNYKPENASLKIANTFIDFFQRVLLDIIDNNDTFVISNINRATIRRNGEIYLQKIEGEEFKKMYKRGFFENIDYVKTNFSAYVITLQIGKMFRYVRLSGNLKKRLEDNINSNKIPISGQMRTYEDYIDIMHYEKKEKKDRLEKIIKVGLSELLYVLHYGYTVILKTFNSKIEFNRRMRCSKYWSFITEHQKATIQSLNEGKLDDYWYFGLFESQYKEHKNKLSKGKELKMRWMILTKQFKVLAKIKGMVWYGRIKVENEELTKHAKGITEIKNYEFFAYRDENKNLILVNNE
ncbi:MAG: hypothetical protein KBT03_08975 [Bacteroidales bacterium]|nr:hypothetical protein [Candidatus Scybalousia scybalohippi]